MVMTTRSKKMRLADKNVLRILNTQSHHRQYNRLMTPEFVESLPENVNFIVEPIMVHEHRMGKSCEPHMRCCLYLPNKLDGTIDEMAASGFQMLIIDVDMNMFSYLPNAVDFSDNADESVGESDDSTSAEL